MARGRTPGMRGSAPGVRGTPGVRGSVGIRNPGRQRGERMDPHARGKKAMKQARIASGNTGRAQQKIRSVGRGGAVTKSGTTAAAFRERAPVDKTAAARQAAARTAGMKIGLPTARPVGRQTSGPVGRQSPTASALASLSGRPIAGKATRGTQRRTASTRPAIRGSGRR